MDGLSRIFCITGATLFLLVTMANAFAETCRASYYGTESGTITASGTRFNPNGMTAAHRSLPFGTRLQVWLGSRSVIVTVTDRGPAARTGRCLDLAKGAASRLGMIRAGVAVVRIERLN